MSRAFVKETTGEFDPLPDLPISPHPNYMTPRGQAALQARLAARQGDLQTLRARADRLDKQPEAAAARDIRYLEARLRTAIVIDPKAQDPRAVAFGLVITVAEDDGHQTRYQITGEDEADAPQGRIAPHSPLARALIGAEPGDAVVWRKPNGTTRLTVLRIDHP